MVGRDYANMSISEEEDMYGYHLPQYFVKEEMEKDDELHMKMSLRTLNLWRPRDCPNCRNKP